MIWLNFWAPDHLQKNLPMKNLWKALAAWMRTLRFQRALRTGTKSGKRRKRSPQTRKLPTRSKEPGHFSLYCGFSLPISSTLAFSHNENTAKLILSSCWPVEVVEKSIQSSASGVAVGVVRWFSQPRAQARAGRVEIGAWHSFPIKPAAGASERD